MHKAKKPSAMLGVVCLFSGLGKRYGSDKLHVTIAGKPIAYYTLRSFSTLSTLRTLVCVIRDEAQKERLQPHIQPLFPQVSIIWAYGGPTRQDSVKNGLEALKSHAINYVLIHDGARPCLTLKAIELLLSKTIEYKAATLATRVTESLRRLNSNQDYGMPKIVDRENLWFIQTPQGFDFNLIYNAHCHHTQPATDDTAVAISAGHSVAFVENLDPNPKLTTPSDLPYIKFLLGF